MMLVEMTTVPDAALPLAQFKEHLRLGSGFSDDGLQDALLIGFLRAALAAVEGRTGKALIERDFRWEVSFWRAPQGQALPIAPVSVVLALSIVDGDGNETVPDPVQWRLVPDLHQPRIEPKGAALPTIPLHGSALVEMTAGFGPSWSDLPADLAQAVLLLAAHYNEYRHEMALGPGCMPFGVSALVERYRSVRISAGSRG